MIPAFMAVSALAGVCLPIGLFLIWRKKYALKAMPMLVGAGIFIVFVLMLERLLHWVVLRPGADGSIALAQKPFLFILYGAFAAGIFEEGGRFLAFHVLKKKYAGVGTALSYGVGHGGMEAVMVLTVSTILSIAAGQMEAFAKVPPAMFLAGGLERVFAMAVHIALSVLVWYAVNQKQRRWLYPVAIVLHALVNVAPGLYKEGVITSILLLEAVTGAWAVVLAFIAGCVSLRDAR